jgi:hypothetical protein
VAEDSNRQTTIASQWRFYFSFVIKIAANSCRTRLEIEEGDGRGNGNT